MNTQINKRKIINDPVHGFISIQHELIFDLLEHPYFQRLRRISQLGLTSLVYPGAIHTRFHHAIGAMHLMDMAIGVIRNKGHHITEEEAEAVNIAILLHDIGHGPYSHTLEKVIITSHDHETLSLKYIQALNEEMQGKLDMAIAIFQNTYQKIRNMLNVFNDGLVVDAKGIYSIEKFLIARRLMYWQVYLHKTVLSAEKLLEIILQRAKDLIAKGQTLNASDALLWFLTHDSCENNEMLEKFNRLDDSDVMSSVKAWVNNEDKILSDLADRLMNRRLFRMELQRNTFAPDYVEMIRHRICKTFDISKQESKYYLNAGKISNTAYDNMDEEINILREDNLTDIADASEMFDRAVLSHNVIKYYLCYPKDLF
jgi:HD superfamily phosphohydrolase